MIRDLDSLFMPNFFKMLFAPFSGLLLLAELFPLEAVETEEVAGEGAAAFTPILFIAIEAVLEAVLVGVLFNQKHFPGRKSNLNSRRRM